VPTSSVSTLNSWGLYLIAAGALVGLMSPQLIGVAADSREGTDWRYADGIRAALDSLSPGMTIVLTYGSWPGADPIHLSGRLISVAYGNGTISLSSRWDLPSMTMSPFLSYRAWIAGTEVQVTTIG